MGPKQLIRKIKGRILPGRHARVRRQMRMPDGVRVYAIGDIHGRADLLSLLHDRIEHDLRNRPVEECILVYLGDYIDRGPGSREVVDILLKGPPFDAETHYLKGNHEDALLSFLDDPGFLRMWRDYGGMETLVSYGVNVPSSGVGDHWILDVHKQFAANLPNSHLAFYQGLELSYANGDFGFVHAGVRPGVRFDRQQGADLMWIRDQFLSSNRHHGKFIVHGHTPQEQPVIHRNRLGIDTGAYITGALTAVAIEGTTFRFIQARVAKLKTAAPMAPPVDPMAPAVDPMAPAVDPMAPAVEMPEEALAGE